MRKIILLSLVLLFSSLNQEAFAKWRFICKGLNTNNITIDLTENSLKVDDGKFKLNMKVVSLGSEEIEAQKIKYKNFFSSEVQQNIVLKINISTGVGEIEFFSDWKYGVANNYQILRYTGCKHF